MPSLDTADMAGPCLGLLAGLPLQRRVSRGTFLSSSLRSTPVEWPTLDASDAELRLDTSDADRLALLEDLHSDLPSATLPSTSDPAGVRLALILLLPSAEWRALDASDAELRLLDTSDEDPLVLPEELSSVTLPRRLPLLPLSSAEWLTLDASDAELPFDTSDPAGVRLALLFLSSAERLAERPTLDASDAELRLDTSDPAEPPFQRQLLFSGMLLPPTLDTSDSAGVVRLVLLGDPPCQRLGRRARESADIGALIDDDDDDDDDKEGN